MFAATEAVAGGNIQLEETASFLGEAAVDFLSDVSSQLGDVNGDGLDDFIISSSGNDEGGNLAGQVYLVFGKVIGWSLSVDAGSVDASFIGEASGDMLGNSLITRGGDYDGDGLDDIAIAAYCNDFNGGNTGRVYVFYGQATGWSIDTPVASANASFAGEIAWSGTGLSTADLNGDGYDDLVVSASGANERGTDYIFFGGATRWTSPGYMANADVILDGENIGDYAVRLSGGGDVNGDGIDDLLVGASGNGDNGIDAGKVYLLAGHTFSWLSSGLLHDYEATIGTYLGEHSGDLAGYAVAIADDLDGDGLDELLIDAYSSDEAVQDGGQVYLLFGKTAGWIHDADLGDADASFIGQEVGIGIQSVAGLGDMNGDGWGDFAIGSMLSSEDALGGGQTYVVLGKPTGWLLDTYLGTTDGAFIGSIPYQYSGNPIGGAGDVNGDGLADLLIGAYRNSEAAKQAGKVYLVMGTECWDVDWDGVNYCDGDCDDQDSTVYPDAPHLCDDLDNDCDGVIEEEYDDLDGDGVGVCDGDCDDNEAAVYLGAAEVACDDLDNDCDGALHPDEVDQDGDGFSACENDCDESDSTLNPADEDGDGYSTCDGDCDDADAALTPTDEDGDGYSTCEDDCDDEDADLNPNDSDGDHVTPCEGDCDDTQITVYEGHMEITCDGLDNDCDGELHPDEADVDGDGYGLCEGDCDDEDPALHPDQEDGCDGIDNDCDGEVDEDCPGDDDDSAADDDDSAGDDDDSAGDDDSVDDDSSGDDDAEDDAETDDETEEPTTCECRAEGREKVEGSLAILGMLAGLIWLRRCGRRRGLG